MALSIELRSLVHQSVALLGEVIQNELGAKPFLQIESIRKRMTEQRSASPENSLRCLRELFQKLENMDVSEQHSIGQAFTLMLELMNICENAYRSYRLSLRKQSPLDSKNLPQAIIYVLTAHPTEARSPENIAIFHQIQNLLVEVLHGSDSGKEVRFSTNQRQDLFHFLKVAWKVSIVRKRSPKVKDEAEHIYSLLFRDGILFSLLEAGEGKVPFYIRSWVGGDKDGHPGVDEKVLLQSLSLSRQMLLRLFQSQIKKVRETLELLSEPLLYKKILDVEKKLSPLRRLRPGDARRLDQLRKSLYSFREDYKSRIGQYHPELRKLCQVMHAFPGLVVPLELRESSDVLMSKAPQGRTLAIDRMLATIHQLSRGCDPRWYARGMIISMTQSMDHIRAAAEKQKKAFGEIRLPVIPLFEEAVSLAQSAQIMQQMVTDKEIHRASQEHWGSIIEMMVGYSDSSKEAGVLASRLAIADALPKLEKVCKKAGLIPVFFHGSGGSIDRGGGSIEDQTAWWPKEALNRYKVTVQGEMVERSLASPQIAQSQISKIIQSAQAGLRKKSQAVGSKALSDFAQRVSQHYGSQITLPSFLSVVEAATPYSYLSALKIGSRPAKRTAQLTVKGLRAIPWVLCWTQTRVLFQTWWGIGSAWEQTNSKERKALKEAFQTEPVFQSYVKALGFTLAKIEMPVWKMYLEQSHLDPETIESTFKEFKAEFDKAVSFFHEITGQKDFLWFRPWLGESIQLRSPMIHPLNLLQIIAQKRKDMQLLRLTVTGISSGLLTTG